MREREREKWIKVLKAIVLIPKAVNQIPTTGQAAKKKCKERDKDDLFDSNSTTVLAWKCSNNANFPIIRITF
jgi:hypothetical protein